MSDATQHTHSDQSPCRICKGPANHNNAHFPFCSERCKQVDLGRWATGAYVVSRPATENDWEEETQGASHG